MKRTDEVVEYLRDVVDRSNRGALPPAYGVFSRTYHRVTLELIACLGNGTFEDPAWIAHLDVRFAETYRQAVERPDERVAPWKVAFEAADRQGKVLLRHLLLGVNAHMTYDLCLALLDGTVDDRARRRRDFDAVNRVMARAIGPVQAVLCAHYPEWLMRADAAGLGIDEFLTYELFVRWRSRAWTDAMAILDGRATLESVASRVAKRARWIERLPA